MSRPDMLLGAIGLYLLVAIVVSSWRRAAGSAEAISAWVALAGLWSIVALPRWTHAVGPSALPVGLGWAAVCYLFARLGYALGGRPGHEKVAWVLGPVHALGLAGFWMTAARRRAKAARTIALADLEATQAPDDVESVRELGETTVGEIMVPRSEIAALEIESRVEDWLKLLRERPHWFVPVFRGELDEIAGCLRGEDLYARPAPGSPIEPLAREIRFVPESMRCDDLLRDLIAAEEHVAIVVDEFGGTAGLVTDQDLFEILLGEIARQDRLCGQVVRLPDGAFLGDGHCRIDDLNERFPVELPEGDYETLAGLVLDRLGRIPSRGERLKVGPVAIEVLDASERRILKLRLTLAPDGGGQPATDQRALGAAQGGDRRG